MTLTAASSANRSQDDVGQCALNAGAQGAALLRECAPPATPPARPSAKRMIRSAVQDCCQGCCKVGDVHFEFVAQLNLQNRREYVEEHTARGGP